jgi:septum formation protein
VEKDAPILLLASASPRRQQLLQQIGVCCEVAPQDIDETPRQDENPEQYVLRLAREKAQSAFSAAPSERVVLGSDTVVVCEGEILGQPRDQADALSMLLRLSGRTHEVLTAVHMMDSQREMAQLCRTEVTFREIQPAEAEAYWKTGEPQGKAGAYGIQGYAAVFVQAIVGSYSGVMGLPLFETAALLQEFGIPCWQTPDRES